MCKKKRKVWIAGYGKHSTRKTTGYLIVFKKTEILKYTQPYTSKALCEETSKMAADRDKSNIMQFPSNKQINTQANTNKLQDRHENNKKKITSTHANFVNFPLKR